MTTLYDYYKAKGEKLPSVADRRPLAEQYGIKNYTGTAEQNNLLLSKLQGSGAPGSLPPVSPLPPAGGSTPAPVTGGGVGGATPAATPEESRGDLTNFRMALRDALNEAGRKRVENNLMALNPGSTATPGTMGSIVDMVRNSVRTPVEQTFSDVITGYTEEQKLKEAKRQSTISMINNMIDNGVFADTPDGTLLEWEKDAGLPEGTMLAWRARVKMTQKMDDEMAQLKLQQLKKDIATKGGGGNGDGTGGATGNFTDIMQEAIDKGATPAQAAREAAAVSEGMGISVNLKMLNEWTAQASKLVKTPQAPVATPGTTTKKTKTKPGPLTGTRPQTTQNGQPLPDYSKIGQSMPDFGAFFSNLWK